MNGAPTVVDRAVVLEALNARACGRTAESERFAAALAAAFRQFDAGGLLLARYNRAPSPAKRGQVLCDLMHACDSDAQAELLELLRLATVAELDVVVA